ncbi:MAG TPA: DEAD/DEAH box helicase [bacterium]|nr:DEAD/DEAH box helicase [bacterium]
MESFQELGLPEFLDKSLRQLNFEKPTPVQAEAIPSGLQGKDVIASAQTGTGKTAAFGIPLLVFLHKNPQKNALILTPTRELAMQVAGVLQKLAGGEPLGTIALLIGGANMNAQFNALTRKPRLVIGTPGRIIDHLNRGSLDLHHTGFLVLDEADRMLDMGFAPQLAEIRKKLTGERQTLLFSATIPDDIRKVAAEYLKDPVRVTIGSSTQPVPKIAQKVLYTTEAKKPEALSQELKERQGSVLVFLRTQRRVDRVTHKLKEQGIKVGKIHGGRTQSQRKQAIEQFSDGKSLVLVATDIAARGLDIHHIAHVINYDLPRNPEDYIHRVGRTARAGAEGESLCFLTSEDKELWGRITRLMGVAPASIPVKPSPFGFEQPREQAPAQPPRHGHPGQARSGQGRHPSRPQSGHRAPGGHSSHGRPSTGGHSPEPGNQARPRHDHPGQRHFDRNGRPAQGRPQNFGGRPQGNGQNRSGHQDHRHHPGQGRPGGQRFQDRPNNRPFQGQPREQREEQAPFREDEERQPLSNASRDWTQKENFFQKLGRKFLGSGGPNDHRPAQHQNHSQGKKEHFWQDDSWGQRRGGRGQGGDRRDDRGSHGHFGQGQGQNRHRSSDHRQGGHRSGGTRPEGNGNQRHGNFQGGHRRPSGDFHRDQR